jgi:DNA-binding transcriptional LysR family regulator
MHRSGLTELDAVLAVARRGSFRAAAKELGMSTTAVSNAVAGLEARLQARLFNRSTRSVALTEAGQRYVQRVGPALAEIHAASEQINSQPQTPAGTLRINTSLGAAQMLLEPLIVEYLRRYPQMKVDIVTEARMIDIVGEGFDAGVRLADDVPRDMIAVPIGSDLRMVVVGAPAYFKRHRKPRSPADLLRHECIALRMAHGGLYRWELERRGEAIEVDISARLILDDGQLIRQAACAGAGLAFVSEWHVANDIASGRLLTVLDEWCPSFAGIRLYFPGPRQMPAGLRALIDLSRELREQGAAGPIP